MDKELEFLRTRNQQLTRERNAQQLIILRIREHLRAGALLPARAVIEEAFPETDHAG